MINYLLNILCDLLAHILLKNGTEYQDANLDGWTKTTYVYGVYQYTVIKEKNKTFDYFTRIKGGNT